MRSNQSFYLWLSLSTWLQFTLATFLRLGSAEPLFIPDTSINWIATGGVLMIKSNDLSTYTVITTGNTLPGLSWVRASELLAKLHNVHPFCTQSRSDWRRWICSAALDLKFYHCTDFFCHFT